MNLNQSSAYPRSSLDDFPQMPIDSAEPYESIIGQRSPLTCPQESDEHYESTVSPNLTGNLTSRNVGNLTQYMNISSAGLSRNVKSIHKLSSTLEAQKIS